MIVRCEGDIVNIDKNDVGIVDMSEEGEVENVTSESSLENILTSGEIVLHRRNAVGGRRD